MDKIWGLWMISHLNKEQKKRRRKERTSLDRPYTLGWAIVEWVCLPSISSTLYFTHQTVGCSLTFSPLIHPNEKEKAEEHIYVHDSYQDGHYARMNLGSEPSKERESEDKVLGTFNGNYVSTLMLPVPNFFFYRHNQTLMLGNNNE